MTASKKTGSATKAPKKTVRCEFVSEEGLQDCETPAEWLMPRFGKYQPCCGPHRAAMLEFVPESDFLRIRKSDEKGIT